MGRADWCRRVWKPALTWLAESGDNAQPQLATVIPYDCRASFVSLHLRAGENPLEVAQWAGHSPRVMFEHYAGVIKELSGTPVLPVAEQILEARQMVHDLDRSELATLMARAITRQGMSLKDLANDANPRLGLDREA